MKQTDIKGYLLTDGERVVRRYFVPIGIPLLLLFSFLLWREAFKNSDSILHWVLAVVWFLFVSFLIVSSYSCHIIDSMQFYIEQNSIANISKSKTDVRLDLSENLFVTTLSIEFGYGKATLMRTFYLFSARSFSIDDIKGNGLNTLKHINRNGIVIIPQKNEIDQWIHSELKIRNIPKFPANIKINQPNQLGYGIMLDG